MLFHLKDGYTWSPGSPIPSTAIDPVMFLSRCLTKAELSYGPSELEVACLVWACKRLRTLLHSNRARLITSLNTTSTDRANRRLVNASIYLSAFPLNVYHLAGRLNLVPDALSRLPGKGDDSSRQREDKPVLDDLWDTDEAVLFLAEARMTDEMRDRFAQAYKADSVYQKIISDLATPPSSGRKPATTTSNEVVVNASKPGHPFRLADHLLYNRDDNGTERLVIPKSLVQEILQVVHDDKHHFGRDRMMKELEMIHFRKKRYLVDQYVKKCHTCGANRQNDKKPIGDYQPIQAPLEPMHTITMDFIVKNKIVELAIRYHAYENPDEDWVDLIPALQWNLNSAHSRVINASPHEYLFGFKIAGPLDRLTGVFKEATEIRFMREAIRQDAQLAIDISNAAAKRRYDGQH
ncbi:retrovirus-related Pol poly protein from transposon gypsy, partial [Elaphomyces granulatus]